MEETGSFDPVRSAAVGIVVVLVGMLTIEQSQRPFARGSCRCGNILGHWIGKLDIYFV